MRKLISILVLSASLALAAPSSVVVQSGDTLGSIAARNGVSVQALLKANNLSTTSTLKIGQVLKIPGGSSSQKTGSITVQSGDTLGSIANRYGISVATLKSINGLSSDSVSIGQVLKLSGSSVKPNNTSSSKQKAKSGTVIVQSGDTLGEIAQANNTTVAALKSLNNLSGNDLKLGQVLKVSGSNKTTAQSSSNGGASSSATVTVKAGDTLGEIAQANNITIAKLKALNGLSSNDLKLGQVLKISGSSQNTIKPNNQTTTNSSNTSKTTVTVKAGDSLSKIAQTNGTTIAALRSLNNLSSDDLKLGQVLRVSNSKASNSSNKTAVVKTTTAKTPNAAATIKVQKGDNLSKIAKQYNVSIDKLRQLNDLKSDDLALGQTLKLKAAVVAKTNKPLKPTSSGTVKIGKTNATNQTKPVTSSKPNTANKVSSSKVGSSAKTSKTPVNTSAKPTVTSTKPVVTTAKKPEIAKISPTKPVTTQKPSTIKASSNSVKPTAAAQNTSKPATVALKPTSVKPAPIVTKPPVAASAPKPTTGASAPKPQISSPKPTQPTVENQANKPVMNEATVQDPTTQNPTAQNPTAQNSAVTTSPPPTTASDASNPSSVTGPAVSSINAQNETPLQNLPPISETDQSQSGVGSDADYIIIEPQNSLEVIGQRTGSVASTTPAKPPTNTTSQQLAKYSRERLLWPLQGVLTSYYGYRSLRIGRSHFHTGLDIAAPRGTPVYAALSGRVEQAGWSRVGYGNLVIIRGWDGKRYYYGHNSRLLVKAGQWVKQGTMISKVGSTGYATGPHLHFEVRVGGHTRNPIAYLPRSQVQFARYAPKR
jgi:LysM repeat protein